MVSLARIKMGNRTALSHLISSAVAALPAPPVKRAIVNVALSGGVDSSVSSFLLKERGWRVRPILMRCWDDDDVGAPGAAGASLSCFARELSAAEAAASALQLDNPVTVFDFVKEYWIDVFDSVFLAGLAAGDTPNPDIACNKYVKFGAFPARLRAEGSTDCGSGRTPPFATGHYARTRLGASGLPLLVRAHDMHKDQTYFLAGISAGDLKSAIFPLGPLLKSQVRDIAGMLGLPSAKARSSRGICFVGKRSLVPFLEKYLAGEGARGYVAPSKSGFGFFVDADTGRTLSQLPYPSYNFTIGQRARIGGQRGALFVCGKTDAGNVLVTEGPDSDRLFTREVFCRDVNWIAGSPPKRFETQSEVRMRCRLNSSAALQNCDVELRGKGLRISFDVQTRRISSGQVVVLYDEDVCLGGGIVGK